LERIVEEMPEAVVIKTEGKGQKADEILKRKSPPDEIGRAWFPY